MTWAGSLADLHHMESREGSSVPASLAADRALIQRASERLLAATGLACWARKTPECPNEEVARILKDLFGDRPIRRGHVSLDMPAVAEDGRVVPVIIESDLPMTAEQLREGASI